MAEINLEDLMKKAAAPSEGESAESKELALVNKALSTLTPEEEKKIAEIRENIDLTDSQLSLQYGNAAQKNIADFSNSILSTVRGRDNKELGELLNSLAGKVKAIEDKDQGFLSSLPILGSLLAKKNELSNSYKTVEAQVDTISAGLENQKMELMKDIVIFDELYDKNLDYFKNLQLYIEAGEEKLVEMREETLPRLRKQAEEANNPMAVQVVKDFGESVNRFEKRVHDLKISKVIAIQTAPQIRLIQSNDKMLVDRIQNAIYNTIPLWKSRMVLALGLARQREALEMQRAVTEATNDLIRKNAEMLKQNTIETVTENERSMVDIETLKKANEELISTVQEAIRIQQEGRKKRQAAEQEMIQIENRLQDALWQGTGKISAEKQ
ncbi:toxic anion resistance protein [Dialister sp.]|uniref:toxic anion resistance protein n=1 Tax=Dialister sp. TaxID=1955814 RepID=UPI002E8083CC|nr:toxic anion resistance protein [Dialister sp.]MEE3453718.1 toxic anion resistance protein [Dialister sp.]